MPKPRHPLSTLSNRTRQLFRHSAAALGSRRLLPKALRKRLNLLGQPATTSPPDNRRKKTTPELQAYIKQLQDQQTEKKIIRDFRELAHYAYVFDTEFYKSQLGPKEADSLHNIGDVILHYCTSGSRNGIDPSNLFDTDNYFSKYPDIKEDVNTFAIEIFFEFLLEIFFAVVNPVNIPHAIPINTSGAS